MCFKAIRENKFSRKFPNLQYEIKALEQIPVQTEAARITTEATYLVSLEMLYQETGWESLEKRTP